MTRRRWIAMLLLAVSAAVIVFVALSSSSDPGPDLAACRTAISKHWDDLEQNPMTSNSRPRACKGVPDKDLNRLVLEVLDKKIEESSRG